MGAIFDGFCCIDSTRRFFGFIVFRQDEGEPVQLVCSMFCWPGTDEGRTQARAQMVRVIDRLRAQCAQPSMRLYG